MSNTTNLSGNAIDAIRPDLEAFSSLWAALRITYGGTNITKTIARLLHMYQPEDGIQAYERLLKTLFVLLEDFDVNGLRLLVSMVPLPKGSSEEMIREVFFKATGFVRIDAPIFHQNYPLLSSMTNSLVGETGKEIDCRNLKDQLVRESLPSKMKELNSTRPESPQMLPQDHHSFRGFSSAEVLHQSKNTQRHDHGQYFGPECNGDHAANLPMNGYKINWSQAPYYFQPGHARQPNSYYRDMFVKTLDNKYLRVPFAHYNPSAQYFNRPYQIVPTDRNVQSINEHTVTSGSFSNASPTIEVSKERYVKREESKTHDEKIETQKRSDLNEHNYNLPKTNEMTLKETNPKTDQDIIRNELYKMDVVNCGSYVPVSIEDCILENLTAGSNLTESIKNFLHRAEKDDSPDLSSTVVEPGGRQVDDTQIKNTDKINNLTSQSQQPNAKNSYDTTNGLADCYNDMNDAIYDQSYSISELAAYKRQYYDALVNVQRAKMAVANSLILAPIQPRTDYESYHPSNLQQHHWIFQHPQRLMVGSSYAQRFVQPEYSVIPNACVRSSDWMPIYHPAGVVQENPSMHAAYDSRVLHASQDSGSQINDFISVETKLEAKKRKLENIVVKLKENEMNSVHN